MEGHRLGEAVPRQAAALGRGGQDAGANLLGQHQDVAGPGAGVGDDAVGPHRAGDEQPELGLLVDDGMAACDDDAGLGADGDRPLEDTPQGLQPEAIDRPGDQAEGAQRLGPHGVHVAERVGRGDASEIEGVVDDGRKHVHGLDQGQVVGNPHHRRVVRRPEAHEDPRIGVGRQPRQGHRQVGLADLGRTAGRSGELGQR